MPEWQCVPTGCLHVYSSLADLSGSYGGQANGVANSISWAEFHVTELDASRLHTTSSRAAPERCNEGRGYAIIRRIRTVITEAGFLHPHFYFPDIVRLIARGGKR